MFANRDFWLQNHSKEICYQDYTEFISESKDLHKKKTNIEAVATATYMKTKPRGRSADNDDERKTVAQVFRKFVKEGMVPRIRRYGSK